MVDISSLRNKGMTTLSQVRCAGYSAENRMLISVGLLFWKDSVCGCHFAVTGRRSKLRRRYDFKQEKKKRKWKMGERLLKRNQR